MNTVEEVLPKANIVHDRFLLVKYLNDAIDKVSRREVKKHEGLKNSWFALLKNRANLTDKQEIKFQYIQSANYEVSKAWRAREDFRDIFGSSSLKGAFSLFIKWGPSVVKSNVKELTKVTKNFRSVILFFHGGQNLFPPQIMVEPKTLYSALLWQ